MISCRIQKCICLTDSKLFLQHFSEQSGTFVLLQLYRLMFLQPCMLQTMVGFSGSIGSATWWEFQSRLENSELSNLLYSWTIVPSSFPFHVQDLRLCHCAWSWVHCRGDGLRSSRLYGTHIAIFAACLLVHCTLSCCHEFSALDCVDPSLKLELQLCLVMVRAMEVICWVWAMCRQLPGTFRETVFCFLDFFGDISRS